MVYRFFTRTAFLSLLSTTCALLYADESIYQQAHILYDQAVTHINEQNYADAVALLKKALELDPHSSNAQIALAYTYMQQELYTDAIALYTELLPAAPHNAELIFNLGVCAYKTEQIDAAICYFKETLAYDTQYEYAYLHLIGAYEKKGMYHEALNTCKQLLSINPTHREGLLSAGIITKQLEQLEDAAWYYRTLYNHYPNDVQAMEELAAVLIMLEQYEEALALYTKALEQKPSSLSSFYNLGFTLKKLNHLDEAIAIYTQILIQKPDYIPARFSRSLAYLTQGNFEAGWADYEWRWETGHEEKALFAMPAWDGSPLNGKKIYVFGEQGYGDTFQFVRYLRELKKQGAYIIFAPQRGLVRFMQLMPFIDKVIAPSDPIPDADYYAALMSLPLHCKTTLDTIPAEIPYLQANPELISRWQPILDAVAENRYRIGICWHGSSQYKDPALRRTAQQKSCALSYFARLAQVPNVQLFSLQKISGIDEIESLDDASFLTIFGDTIDTIQGRFVDTAAIITQLDLVITVDTSIAHLAAALGIETWILLPEPADWRWMLNRTDSPWYPNVRLFRQKTRGDWQEIMEEVAVALSQRLEKKENHNA